MDERCTWPGLPDLVDAAGALHYAYHDNQTLIPQALDRLMRAAVTLFVSPSSAAPPSPSSARWTVREAPQRPTASGRHPTYHDEPTLADILAEWMVGSTGMRHISTSDGGQTFEVESRFRARADTPWSGWEEEPTVGIERELVHFIGQHLLETGERVLLDEGRE